MERLPRKIYTYEFKLEAVRLVESGQSIVSFRQACVDQKRYPCATQ